MADCDALDYVRRHLQELTPEQQKQLVEWFFSGSYRYRSEEVQEPDYMKEVNKLAFNRNDLHAAAFGLLGSKVQPEIVKNPELAREICAGLRRGKPARDGTITMAQAIVLTLGIRALEGEKGAAEFLEKLSQQPEEESGASEDVVVRVALENGEEV